MTKSIRKMIVLCLWVVVVFLLAAPNQAQESKPGKVKLTGAELIEGVNRSGVSAGVDKKNKIVSIVVDYPDGKRELYWQSFAMPGLSGSWTGTRRVVGDQFCHKLTFNPEICFDVYRVDEDKSEIWSDEGIQVISYRLK